MHDSFAGQELASIQVLVQTASGTVPGPADCAAWRDKYGLEDVVTLYDPLGATTPLWETNYTSLNVFMDRNRVIRQKLHTDNQTQITAQIQDTLNAP